MNKEETNCLHVIN